MATKAEMIARANTLRRNADRLRRANAAQFRTDVAGCGMALLTAGFSEDQITELLPNELLAAPSACRLKPLADHVVIRPAAAKATTDGGLVIPDSAKEIPMQGEVLAVGPGRIDPGIGTVLPAVNVGDAVLFGRYAGVEVTLDGEDVRIMREEDILGILAPEAAGG